MSWVESNGILAKVAGQFVAQGAQSLPRPGADQAEQLTAELDAGEAGRVRITYQLASSRHHKSRNWYWRAVFAEALGPV